MLIEIPDVLAGDVESLISNYHHACQLSDQLNSDDGLEEWLNDGCAFADKTPMVRESTYDGHVAPFRRLNLGRWSKVKDPPVVMRGARYALHRRYVKGSYGDCPNGWNERVVERFIRMKKLTAMHQDSPEYKNIWKLVNKNSQFKGTEMPRIGLSFDGSCGGFYLNGIRRNANGSVWQALKSLLRHADKITNIEKQAARIIGSDVLI